MLKRLARTALTRRDTAIAMPSRDALAAVVGIGHQSDGADPVDLLTEQ